ncbi:MAG TPA: hypothetical protein DF383_01645 [Deltaproteobacteria bacterium]|nr:hypothetical protein [Deltaproteobacteria bacterium]
MLLHNGRASTVDIGFYLLVNDLHEVAKLFKAEKISVKAAGDFQLKTKRKGVAIDLLLADHYAGADVVRRACEKRLGSKWIRVATPEDLIVLKTLADRSIDRRDIEELRELFKGKLDEVYVQKKLKNIGEVLEK